MACKVTHGEAPNRLVIDVIRSFISAMPAHDSIYNELGVGVVGVQYELLNDNVKPAVIEKHFDFFFDGTLWAVDELVGDHIAPSGHDNAVGYFDGLNFSTPVTSWADLHLYAKLILVPTTQYCRWFDLKK